MEALVLSGGATREELQAAMAATFAAAAGRSLGSVLGDDWATVHPFPAIPFYQERAPVVPSTGDAL
jgi:hypothetical protein